MLPILNQAIEALEHITRDDMTQLRSYATPPISAAIVMEGVAIAFSEDDNVKGKGNDPPTFQEYWDYAKKYLLNEKLIKRVKGFKLENIKSIPENKIFKLKQFITNPFFDKEKVFNASQAAGNLSLWIRAVLDSYEAVVLLDKKKIEL